MLRLISVSCAEVLFLEYDAQRYLRCFLLFLQDAVDNDGDSDEGEALLCFWTSIGWLTILTIFISILSEYLVDAIEVCFALISIYYLVIPATVGCI